FLNIYFEKIETIEKSSQKQTLVFPADSLQNMIVDLMNECIFIIETSETIPVEILEVKKEEDTYSITILKKRRNSKTEFGLPIKAATYHQLEIKTTPNYFLRIIFDV
ncbi:MAG: archease, partial [bacterium]|nr:archease [bacterium]